MYGNRVCDQSHIKDWQDSTQPSFQQDIFESNLPSTTPTLPPQNWGHPLLHLLTFTTRWQGAVNPTLIRLRVRPDHTYHPADRVITAYARAVNHTITGG